MRRKQERLLAGFLIVVMVMLCIPVSVFAGSGNQTSVTQTVTTNTDWDAEHFSEEGNSELDVDRTEYPYSMVAVGDTQAFLKIHGDNFHQLYDWILENRSEKNIRFVMGLGDITDDNNESQWSLASEQMKRLDGYVPYSFTVGNHDGYFYQDIQLDLFHQAFRYSEYQYAIGGTYDGNMENSWQTFSVGETDYLVLALDYMPGEGELAWADEVVKAHPAYNVIVTTHAYVKYDEENQTVVNCTTANDDGSNQDASYSPITGIQNLVDANSNIVLVLCGHEAENNAENPIGYRVRTREDGSSVVEMLINPQCEDADFSAYGCTGMVAVFYFSEDGKNVQVRYYSTVRDRYYSAKSQLSISDFPVVQKSTDRQEIVYLKYEDISAYRTEKNTAPVHPDTRYQDYIFAGWMTSGDGKDISIGTTAAGGCAYAKFVSPEVLSVKAQVTKDTQADTVSTNLRFVTTVDSLKYREIGFEFTLNGKEKVYAYPSDKVFQTIQVAEGREGDAVTYTPQEQFSSASQYFHTITVSGIGKANYQASFHVSPYWITQDGTKVYGVDRFVHVRDGYLDTISAKIDVDTEADVSAGMCYISYDKDNLTYLDSDKGSVFPDENMIHDADNGLIGIIGNAKGEEVSAQGVLTNLNFVRKSDSDENMFTFETLGEQFSNAEEQIMRLSVDDVVVVKETAVKVQSFALRTASVTEESTLDFTITDTAPYVQAPAASEVPTIFYTRGTYDTDAYETHKIKGGYVSNGVLVNGESGKMDTIRLNPNGGSFYMSSSDYLNGYTPKEGDILTIPANTVFTSETDSNWKIRVTNEYKIQLVYQIDSGLLRWVAYQEVSCEPLEMKKAAFHANASGHYFYSEGNLKGLDQYVGKTFQTSDITVNGKRGIVTTFTIGSGDFTAYSPYISYGSYTPKDGDVLVIPQGARAVCTTNPAIGIEISYGAKYYYDADASNARWIYSPYYNQNTAETEIKLQSYGFDVAKNKFYMKSNGDFSESSSYSLDQIMIDGQSRDLHDGWGITLTTDTTSHDWGMYVLVSFPDGQDIQPGTCFTISEGTIAQNGEGSASKYLKIMEEVSFIYAGGNDGKLWIMTKEYPDSAEYEEVILGKYNFNSGNTLIIHTGNGTKNNTKISGKSFATDDILVNGVRGLMTGIGFYGDSDNMYISPGSSYTPENGDVITIPAGAKGYASDGTYIRFTNGITISYVIQTVNEEKTTTATQGTYYYTVELTGCEHSSAQSVYGFKLQAKLPESVKKYLEDYSLDVGLLESSELQLTQNGDDKGTVCYKGSAGYKDGSDILHLYQENYGTYKPVNGTVLTIPAGTRLTSTWTGVTIGFVTQNAYRLCYYNGQWQTDETPPVVKHDGTQLTGIVNLAVKEGFSFEEWKKGFTATDSVTGTDTVITVTGIQAENAVLGVTYDAVVTAADLFGNAVSYQIHVTVKEGMTGDADDDDAITIRDMVHFLNWLRSSDTYTILMPDKRMNFDTNTTADENDIKGLGEYILTICKPDPEWL